MKVVNWNSRRDEVLAAVKKNPRVFETIGSNYQDNEEIALATIRENAAELEFASERLRGKKHVVLEAVKYLGSALQHASNELRVDKDLVLEALMRNPPAKQEHSLMNDAQWAEMVGLAQAKRLVGDSWQQRLEAESTPMRGLA